MSRVENTTLHTKHFTVAIDRVNRTLTRYGDFSHTDVRQIPDNPFGADLLGDLIAELQDLQSDICLLVGLKEVTYDLTQISHGGGEDS